MYYDVMCRQCDVIAKYSDVAKLDSDVTVLDNDVTVLGSEVAAKYRDVTAFLCDAKQYFFFSFVESRNSTSAAVQVEANLQEQLIDHFH